MRGNNPSTKVQAMTKTSDNAKQAMPEVTGADLERINRIALPLATGVQSGNDKG